MSRIPKPPFTLGQSVQEYRAKRKNMSQEDLAKKVRVSRQTIISIEGGRTDPCWSTVKGLSTALRMPLDPIIL